MNWQSIVEDFKNFLKLEKNLSENTANAYSSDLKKLIRFFKENNLEEYNILKKNDLLNEFIRNESKKINSSSQSRLISSLKRFFNFMILEKYIDENPLENISHPRLGSKLPITLNINEIDSMMARRICRSNLLDACFVMRMDSFSILFVSVFVLCSALQLAGCRGRRFHIFKIWTTDLRMLLRILE